MMILTAFFALAGAASANDDVFSYTGTGVDIGGEYEVEALSTTVPKTNDASSPTHARDTSRSGPRVVLSFHGVQTQLLFAGHGRANLTFLPLSAELDVTGGVPDGFGQVSGAQGSQIVRKAVGALIETAYEPETGIVSFRGKLARVDYDRDKGFWDWKALQAEVVIKKMYPLANGSVAFDLEVSAGVGFGGVYMNGLADLEKALGAAPASNSALTLNPMAAMRVGFHGADWRVGLASTFEERVGLSGGSSYLGNAASVRSEHVNVAIDGQYTFFRQGTGASARTFSVFVNAGYDYDNLTLSHMFFGTNDAFNSFRVLVGVRGTF
ncbi:MAG: hypothetical protein HY075_03695 [Deltaproteobacteria bacterium]|nr:hypothetical protein [Deltaproteobacteria bacterium]